MKTTFVFGAGADYGIFPLTNHLMAAINTFLENDPAGIEINSLLKKKLGFSTFSYPSIMDNAAYSFVRRNDQAKIDKLLTRLNNIPSGTLDEEQKTQLVFIKKLAEIMTGTPKRKRDRQPVAEIDELIPLSEQSGLTNLVTVCPETTVSAFLQQSIRMLLRNYLRDPKNKILHTLFKSIVNLDEILLEYFLGFYNGNKACIRKYEYLLWTMWAFFVNTEISYHQKSKKTGTLYEEISGCPVITLNYTTLATLCTDCPELLHFHGSVLHYIDCQTREEKKLNTFRKISTLAAVKELDTAEILKNDILPLIEVHRGRDSSPDKCIIPSMMPPFEIKPIIANDLIDNWHHAFELLRDSKKIIIVGYSFNHTDSHFNDIILDFVGKKKKDGSWEKQILIVNPDKNTIPAYFDRLPAIKNYTWKEKTIGDKEIPCLVKANITFIPCTAASLKGNIRYII